MSCSLRCTFFSTSIISISLAAVFICVATEIAVGTTRNLTCWMPRTPGGRLNLLIIMFDDSSLIEQLFESLYAYAGNMFAIIYIQ